jgi:hypothetical protein
LSQRRDVAQILALRRCLPAARERRETGAFEASCLVTLAHLREEPA